MPLNKETKSKKKVLADFNKQLGVPNSKEMWIHKRTVNWNSWKNSKKIFKKAVYNDMGQKMLVSPCQLCVKFGTNKK